MSNKFKCIIFDFDGTLADTSDGIIKTFIETFRHLGKEIPSDDEIRKTIGLTLPDGFRAFSNVAEDEIQDCITTYRSLFPGIAYANITVFPGVINVLGQLKDRGIRMAIATSRSHHSLGILSEQIGVAPYFEGLYAAEDTERHKPFPDLVLYILGKMGLKADEVLVVGDAVYDLQMGKGAGCKVCGVTWGNQPREMLETAKPEFIIDSIDELPALV